IAPPKSRAASPAPTTTGAKPKSSSFSLGAALQSIGERLQGRGRPTQPAGGRGRAASGPWSQSPEARGGLVAGAAGTRGAPLVWGMYRTVLWFFPAGQVLTITKPTGGTIVGAGIECGTGGSKCSTHVATGEPVELEARPDKGFVYSGFTGDCGPTGGRVAMTQARTCGATFGPVTAAPTAL